MQLTIIDRVINASNTVQALFDTAQLNGIGITDDIADSVPLIFSTVSYSIAPIVIKSFSNLGYYGQVKIKRFQKLPDFVTQFGGSLNSLFDIAMLNGVGITDEIAPGTPLFVSVQNSLIVSYYKNSTQDIITRERNVIQQPGGIGYMQIGYSFKVS